MPAKWKGIVGTSFSIPDFDTYCHGLRWDGWRPSFVVLHNTAIPSLAQRPDGLSRQNMKALEVYYRDIKKWSAGPHLFIDDRKVWVFTPLTVPGVHSPSWNNVSLGVEMLGDYERECFNCGRGMKVRNNTLAALATLCSALQLQPSGIRLHYEDPLTTHRCPGQRVIKAQLQEEVQQRLNGRSNDLK